MAHKCVLGCWTATLNLNLVVWQVVSRGILVFHSDLSCGFFLLLNFFYVLQCHSGANCLQ